MEKSKGKKIAIIVIVAIFAAAVVGVSVWQITVDVMAKNIGLVKVNDLSYDAPLDVVAEEGDVQLQDVRMHYAKVAEAVIRFCSFTATETVTRTLRTLCSALQITIRCTRSTADRRVRADIRTRSPMRLWQRTSSSLSRLWGLKNRS